MLRVGFAKAQEVKVSELIANPESHADSEKAHAMGQIHTLLQGVLSARGRVLVKMNVPGDRIEELMELMPSLQAPTVAHLYNSDWLSIEAVIQESVVRELIPRLLKKGATGIVEYPLNKII